MNIPIECMDFLKSNNTNEINIGHSGIKMFKMEEIESGQIGYSVDNNGNSLNFDDEKSWNIDWIVIGYETGMGDPIIYNSKTGSIYTAQHGDGEWNLEIIAKSLNSLFEILKIIKEASINRESPDDIENNPILKNEIDYILKTINAVNNEVNANFWLNLLDQ